jgi:hypothetical protein
VFYAAADSTTSNELFRIQGNGNVGIGISNPSSNAYGHGGTNKILQIHNANFSANAQSQLVLSSGTYTGPKGGINWVHTGGLLGEARAAFIGCEADNAVDNHLVFFTKGGTSLGTLSEKMRITANGNIGIGTSNPSIGKLEVSSGTSNPQLLLMQTSTTDYSRINFRNGNSASQNRNWDIAGFTDASTAANDRLNFFRLGLGDVLSLQGNGNAVLAGTLTQLSDKRLKTNIQPLQNSLQRIRNLNGYTYNWLDKNRDNKTQIGFLAQEVQAQFPELTTEIKQENGETILGVNYVDMIPVLLEAIKEQQKQIEELKNKLTQAGIE